MMDCLEKFKKEWHKALDEDDATWMITGDGAPKPETAGRPEWTPRWLKEYQEEVVRAVVMEEDEAWVGPEMSIKSRFRELLEQHPKMTRYQVYLLAVMEIIGYQGYLVPPELAPGVLAQLENNDGDIA